MKSIVLHLAMLLLYLVSQMLSCTTVLHFELVSALLVVIAILLPWDRVKILLHLVPYPDDSVTNDNQPQSIVSHSVTGAGPNQRAIISALKYIW